MKKFTLLALVFLAAHFAFAAGHIVTISHTNVSCFGGTNGTASATVTGGVGPFWYNWTPSGGTSPLASGLAAGSYTVWVTDQNDNSVSSQTVTITQPTMISLSPMVVNPTCNSSCNGSISVMVMGGTPPYTYYWPVLNQSTSSVSGLCPGSYTCNVTDANGCMVSATYTLLPSNNMNVALSANAVTCNSSCNGSATAIPSGGTAPYTYLWTIVNATTATATNLCPATYTCTVTDANGCTASNAITVTQPTPLTNSPNVYNASCNSVCDGSIGQVVVGGTPPYSYYWPQLNVFTQNANSLCAGAYSCLVTDANGCTFNANYTITQPAPVNVTVSPTNPVVCANTPVTLTAAGAVVYSWVPGNLTGVSVVVTPTVTTTYTVAGTDASGCTGTAVTTVFVNQNPQGNAGTIIPAGCNMTDGSADVIPSSGTPPYTYVWNTVPAQNTQQASSLATGTYLCTVTDANGCLVQVPVTVTDSCDYVWPGDANDDAVADNIDILDIGIANGATGTTRANASTNWIGQPSAPWGQTLLSGTDYKWVDCNGDGSINPVDTNAVVLNFGYTHNNRIGAAPVYDASLPDLAIVMNQQQLTAGNTGTLSVMLGTSANPATNVYGLAFTLNFDGTQIDAASFRMNENGSWMGTAGNDLMGVVLRPATAGNSVQVALTRLDQNNANGSGAVANMAFTASNNLLGSGNAQNVNFTISDVTLLSANETVQQVNALGDSVLVTDTVVVTGVIFPAAVAQFSVFPNPFNEQLTIILPDGSAGQPNEIIITDVQGRIIRSEKFSGKQITIDSSSLASGLYFVSVYSGGQPMGTRRISAE